MPFLLPGQAKGLSVVCTISPCLSIERKAKHMQTLWGEDETPQPAGKVSHHRSTSLPVILKASDCLIYGHPWQPFGMSGEKRCSVCRVIGYCPVCTPLPPTSAQ